jgi:hypothetical protein
VVVEMLPGLPRWIYVGVFVGALVSVGVAATFLVAARLFPDGNRQKGTWDSTESRRRAEIRQYLDTIGERFVEDTAPEGVPVAFYLPARGVAITFQPRTFYALEGTPVHPVLVEHEMPGIALGHRLPFETPNIRFGDDDETAGDAGEIEPIDAAYAVLGVNDDADTEAIRRAYRERVKEVHPDHGGSEEDFRRVRDAYDTARQHAS